MTKEYTAIRVSKEAREAAEASKKDGETWDEYVRRCTENPPEVKEYVESDCDPTQIADAIKNDLSMAADPGVDEEKIVNEVCKRLDDLESQLPKKVAEEFR